MRLDGPRRTLGWPPYSSACQAHVLLGFLVSEASNVFLFAKFFLWFERFPADLEQKYSSIFRLESQALEYFFIFLCVYI